MLLFVLACGTPSPDPEPPPPPALTEEQSRAVGKAFVAALEDGCDADAIDQMIDADALATRASEVSSLPREDFVEMLGKVNLGAGMCLRPGQFDQARVLRVEADASPHHVLVRRNGPGGFSYLDLLVRADDGEARIVDVMLFAAGQHYSESLADSREALEGVSNVEMLNNRSITARVNNLEAAGKFAEARELLNKLPESVRTSRIVMLRDVLLAARVGPEALDEAQAAFAKKYPDDPALLLQSIDRYMLQKRYDEALAAVDRVDDLVGGDTYLEVIRGNIQRLRGNHEVARGHFEAALQSEPDLAEAHLGLLEVALSTRDYLLAAQSFTALRNLGREPAPETMVQDRRYTRFFASPEGQGLLEAPLP